MTRDRAIFPALLTGLLALVAPAARAADLLISSTGATNAVLRYDGATGAPLGAFVSGAPLVEPHGLAYGPDGNLYVGNGAGSADILRYQGQTGSFLGAFGSPDDAILTRQITFGPDGNIYTFGSPGGSLAILRYNATTGMPLPSAGNTGAVFSNLSGINGNFVEGLAFGPDGNLYYSYGAEVHRVAGATGSNLGTFATTGGQPNQTLIAGLTFGPDGNLYAADLLAGVVDRFNGTTGAALPSPGNSGAVFANGNGIGLGIVPFGVAFGPDGNLYMSSENGFVMRYNGVTGAYIDTFVPLGTGGLSSPGYMIFTPTAAAVPEPSGLVLCATAGLCLVGRGWLRRRAAVRA
jgi:hypothetical protein